MISGKNQVLKFLIESADVDEGHEDEVVDAGLQVLSTMVQQSSGDTVAYIVKHGVFKVFTDFLGRSDTNNFLLLTDVLDAIERICDQGLAEGFHGWDEINKLATSFHHQEVSTTAQRIHRSYCPSDHCEWELDSENDVTVRNLFSDMMITHSSSKRRKVCNGVPVLGISNRR